MDRRLRREDQHLDLDPAPCECHVMPVPGGGVIICVHGEIDGLTAPTFKACLDQQLAPASHATSIEVALAHTGFLGACGLTTLLAAAQTARLRAVDFRITGCSARLLRLFDLVGVREELAVIG